MTQPRASVWLTEGPEYNPDRTLTAGQWSAGINSARSRLQKSLQGTGLNVVGKPVVERVEPSGNVLLSWKVFSGSWPTEEAERG
jgi:hypothetical protein